MESKLSLELNELFQRDIDRLIANLKEMPEEILWKVPEGVNNSCGVLAQHLVGNLRFFIGKGLGKRSLERDRRQEFRNTGKSREQLISELKELQEMLGTIFSGLESKQIDEAYDLDIPFEMSPKQFLVHLYGHLNYHLGQCNCLRRLMSNSQS